MGIAVVFLVPWARRTPGACAEAIILGCTEIMLLIRREDSAVPTFDTTTLHAHAAVEFALAEG